MTDKLTYVREKSREMARQCNLDFYIDFAAEHSLAKEIFFTHPLMVRLREDVLPFLNDGYGHGIKHSKLVAIDAGTLGIIETKTVNNPAESKKFCILAQMCGLLHDICRLEDDHAVKAAEFSEIILKDYPLSTEDKNNIAFAVRTHEAFKTWPRGDTSSSRLLSAALYDADKFRWGPDNFITTLWEICYYEEWTLQEIIERFPAGLQMMEKIIDTFRTPTGRIYGPEFIRCGLEIGSGVYRLLKQDVP
ncbi:MAG: hypothetical protein D5R98_02620 [Desulfonatronovibrio sp. MSAO_Bac4]|nr:MAG: hypothetical protein D5R98_02620 [Desulfonatronovibrio sp. MSAO_Bac4]